VDPTDLDYEYPASAVAQHPAARRDEARLLGVPAASSLTHGRVADLPGHCREGDVLVLNDSSVQPARLSGRKASGGAVELLVLDRRVEAATPTWVALVGAAHAPKIGTRLVLDGGVCALVAAREGELFVLEVEGDMDAALAGHGRPPLPPYIHRPADATDRERYQTTFAVPGDWGTAHVSSAAPTAGLHLTPELLAAAAEAGATVLRLSLGVGVGTFRPVDTPRVEDHRMHEERIDVPEETAEVVTRAVLERRRVTAVGTTALRALEAAATAEGRVRAVRGRTGLFLLPGSPFRVVSRLLTNFHQPRTTLLALVHAFGGRDRVRAAYAEAIARGYRLFSYGDAMLVERAP
jgi:S-adenosylmethionine:tRNA ribosyltransferase-isomerase